MDNRLYELMNWPRIEALVYSEEDEPQEIIMVEASVNLTGSCRSISS